MSLKRKIMTGLLWTAAQNSSQQVVGLITFSVLAGILGPEPFGLMAMAMVVVTTLTIVVNQGLLEGLLQRAEIEPIHLSSMFWFILTAAILFAAGMLATAGPVARVYGQPDLGGVLQALSPVPIFMAVAAVPAALLRRKLQFRTFVIRTMFCMILGAIVGITLALRGFGAWALVGNLLTQEATNAIVLWFATDWRPRLLFSWRRLRSLLAYGVQIALLRGLSVLDNQAPRFFIGSGLGPIALGELQLATTVLRFIKQLFVSPFSMVGMPATARIQNDPRKVERLLSTATRVGNLLLYPAFVGIAVTAPLLVPVMFGPKWLAAVPVLQIMTLSGFAGMYVDLCAATLRGLGKPQWLLVTRVIRVTVSVILAVGAVRYGVLAVAAVLAIRGIIFLPMDLWVLRRAGGPRLGSMIGANFPIFVAALLMGACVFGWMHFMREELGDRTLLASAISVGVLTYAVFALILTRPLLREMLSLLRSLRGSAVRAPGE
jgi:PST family polysaccharide transporter